MHDHTKATRFTLDECRAAIGRRAELHLTGTIVDADESDAGPFVKFQPDPRWGFGDYRLVIDLDAIELRTQIGGAA